MEIPLEQLEHGSADGGGSGSERASSITSETLSPRQIAQSQKKVILNYLHKTDFSNQVNLGELINLKFDITEEESEAMANLSLI